MQFQHSWYRLDLKKEVNFKNFGSDASLLQDGVLWPIFGIMDPRSDQRLSSWAPAGWDQMLKKAEEHATTVLFTLCPISPQSLMQLADQGMNMLPKSTFIEPKVPYGLLLKGHQHKR